jgi:hypothetical protein
MDARGVPIVNGQNVVFEIDNGEGVTAPDGRYVRARSS